jgi:lactate racemase
VQITVKHDLWNGDYDLRLELSDEWQVEILGMAGSGKRPLIEGDYRKALSPLTEMLKGAKEVCVLFDDLSRPTRAYQIVPFLVELFERVKIRDEQVRFICALGTHAPHDNADFRKKLGTEALERFAVYNHNPYENCLHLGTTTLGTPVLVNKEYLACDARIALGAFVPHSFCGFSGGYKTIMPAISHIDAIEYHHGTLLRRHWDAAYAIGRHEGNPLLADLREYGRITRLDTKIDVLVNEKAEHTGIFAGNPDALYDAMIPEAVRHYGTRGTRSADIVIVNAYGKGNEAVIALSLAEHFLKEEGGDIVVLCDTPGGQVVHYLLGRFGKETAGRLHFGERTKDGRVRRIFMFSRYRDRANEWWFGRKGEVYWMDNLAEIVAALEEEHKGPGVKVYVIPDGTIQMPV